MYISAWEIHTGGIRSILAKAAKENRIDDDDVVWRGPSGDAVVAASPAELDEEYIEYTDSGLVKEYLD